MGYDNLSKKVFINSNLGKSEIIIIDTAGNKPYPTVKIIINLRRPPLMDKADKNILKAIINGNKTSPIKIINLRSHIGVKIFIKNKIRPKNISAKKEVKIE